MNGHDSSGLAASLLCGELLAEERLPSELEQGRSHRSFHPVGWSAQPFARRHQLQSRGMLPVRVLSCLPWLSPFLQTLLPCFARAPGARSRSSSYVAKWMAPSLGSSGQRRTSLMGAPSRMVADPVLAKLTRKMSGCPIMMNAQAPEQMWFRKGRRMAPPSPTLAQGRPNMM